MSTNDEIQEWLRPGRHIHSELAEALSYAAGMLNEIALNTKSWGGSSRTFEIHDTANVALEGILARLKGTKTDE